MMKRPWLPPLLSILFGILLLVAVEGVLRLAWDPSLLPDEQLAAVAIDPFEVSGDTARTKQAYLGAMRSSSFLVPKPEGTFRIFCLGGSTTLGYPYPARFAWPASLERRFQLLFPARRVEVINVGGTSYGSARTLAVLRGLLAYQPDLVIVATGDAEFVEDSFRVAASLPAPAVSWLHGLYLSRGLKQLLPGKEVSGRMIDAEDLSAAGVLFAPVVAGTVYRVDTERRASVMAALENNLRQMTEIAAEAKIPMVLMTLPANVGGWPPDPDPSVPKAPELVSRWRRHVSAAEGLTASGHVREALAEYAAATELWNGNATICYDYGQLLIKAKQFDAARLMLLRALDLDPVPVRANPAVNQLLRNLATQAGVLLADAARSLTSLSPHGILGEELILDYAHPTPRGHVEIARVVLKCLVKNNLDWRIDAVQELAAHQNELSRIKEDEPKINAELSFTLGQVFERKGLVAQAEEMYRQAIDQGYRGPFPAFNLARLQAVQGHFTEALATLSPIPAQYPNWQEPYALLGYLYQQTGDSSAAVRWYRRALDAGNPDPRLFASLAELQLSLDLDGASRQTLEEGLERHPGNCDLAAMLGRTLERQAADAAETFYRQNLKADPFCHELAENFGLLLMAQRRWTEARDVFLDALRQPVVWPQHHLNLGYIYWQGLADDSAARVQFDAFLKLQPERVELIPGPFRKTAKRGALP